MREPDDAKVSSPVLGAAGLAGASLPSFDIEKPAWRFAIYPPCHYKPYKNSLKLPRPPISTNATVATISTS